MKIIFFVNGTTFEKLFFFEKSFENSLIFFCRSQNWRRSPTFTPMGATLWVQNGFEFEPTFHNIQVNGSNYRANDHEIPKTRVYYTYSNHVHILCDVEITIDRVTPSDSTLCQFTNICLRWWV